MKKQKKKNVKVAEAAVPSRIALRAFFISKETKKPLAKVPIVAALENKIAGNAMKFIIAKLATSENGYISFKADAEKVKAAGDVLLYPFGLEELAFSVKNTAVETAGEMVHMIELDAAQIADLPKENIHAVQYADLIDYDYMPLFTSAMSSSCQTVKDNVDAGDDDDDCKCKDEDCCALIPQFPIEECLNIFQFDRADRDPDQPVEFKDTKAKTSLWAETGIIRQYETCYTPLGYSLGDLLHSMPLAPCESVNIGVKNWFREDFSSRSDVVDRSETLENQVIRSRNAQEFIKSKMTQHSFNFGLSAAFKIKQVPISLNLGYAFGSKKASAEMVQEINETQSQLSNAYSSYKSLVVTETTQNESLDMTTRNVTNHNHCHTLTMMYYEVIQNLKVSTTFKREKEAVFIQYDTPCFTKEDLLCYRHIFREVLLDMKLLECLDNICLDEFNCADDDGDGSGSSQTDCVKADKLRITVRITDKIFADSEGSLYLIVRDKDGNENKYYIPHSPDGKYKKNKTYTTEISIAPICVEDIERIGLELNGNDQIQIASLNVEYHAMAPLNSWHTLFSSGLGDHKLRNAQWWQEGELNPDIPSLDIPDPAGDDPAAPGSEVTLDCCVNNLLHHLNCNKHFYYKILWMLEDENQRAVRFENHLHNGEHLIDFIVNKPLGVVGDWVVFERIDADWKPAIRPTTETMILNAPTGNLFTEALLGQCNSCETIDDDRFWDWSGKTCPNSAPELSLDSLSKYQQIASALSNPFQNPLLKLLDTKDVLQPSSALSSILTTFAETSIVNNPAAAKEVMQDLIKLLDSSPASTSTDPDTQDSFDNIKKMAEDLKALFESLEGLFGSN